MMFHIERVLEGAFSLLRIDWKWWTAGESGGWPVGRASVSVLELKQR
jgi:hypothetical protein